MQRPPARHRTQPTTRRGRTLRRLSRTLVVAVAGVGLLASSLVAGAQPSPGGPPGSDATAYDTQGLKSMSLSPRSVAESANTDLAFWDRLAFQGSYSGFRIIDIKAPARPRELAAVDDCDSGPGDLVVHTGILVRSSSDPAPDGGGSCGGIDTPAGEAGVHVFDVSDPSNPTGVAFVATACGSHGVTAVPDAEHDRLLIYSSPSDGACEGIDIIAVPFDDPSAASYVRFEPSGQPAGLPNLLRVREPSPAAGNYQATQANFGPLPDVPSGDLHDHDEPDPDLLIVTGDLVVVNSSTGNPTQGCGPLVDFPEGAIAVADRGGCAFVQIVGNAQAAGAAAVIVVNNTAAAPINLGGTDPSITIPSAMISQADGEAIKAGLPAVGTLSGNPLPPIPVQDRACRDTAVVLGDAMRAACAGDDGVSVWSLGGHEGGSLTDPRILYSRPFDEFASGNSVAFSVDGEILVVGHAPSDGEEASCQDGGSEADRTLYFIDTETGAPLGEFVLPRPQGPTENCAWGNFHVVPTDEAHLLVSGNFQAGISVVDFTDPFNAVEVAYADPAPIDPDELVVGGTWAAYYYDGWIYESDMRGGLRIWNPTGLREGARKLGHLNPQTRESTFELANPFELPTGSFNLVGHDSLLDRGMNAAIAIHGDYAYIGSRTDLYEGDESRAGIMVVDISDPTDPTVVNVVGQPRSGGRGESSRELRVWQSQDILVVLHTNCSGALHNCTPPSTNNLKFFDISGENAADPQLIAQVNQNTHEYFLWEDPFDDERAFLFGGSAGSGGTALSIWDLAPLLDGQAPPRIHASQHGYTRVPPSGPLEIPTGGLHSLSLSNDGQYAYYALLTGGFAVVDVSDFTSGADNPQLRLVTQNELRPTWPGPGTHSAVKLWGRDWVYVSDEVYGTAAASGHGCPWGWARMIDISDPTAPTVESEYRVDENWPWLCHQNEPRPNTSYSAHNPTLTPNIAFTTWHSNGFQAISLEDPYRPYQLAEYMPDPLESVVMEDPRLSSDPDTGQGEKVVMWSYPIIKDGLIYMTDVRNGLYILEYEGPFEDEVDSITFLEGNSNLGHALCFEPVLKPKDDPNDPDEYLLPDYC